MSNKPIIIGVSVILFVGVVIGAIVVGMNHNGRSSTGEKSLSPHLKAVEIICQPATYTDKCMSTISPIAANSSASPKDFLRAALAGAMEEIKGGLEKSGGIKSDRFELYDKRALNACKDLLNYAITAIQEALKMLEANELQAVNDEVDEFRNWLTAVDAYQVTCTDQIKNPDFKAKMHDGLRTAIQLTNNALDIFSDLSKILTTLKVPLKANPSHRKLLGVADVDEGGYPHWFSEEDRRLLLGEPKPNVVVAKDGSGQFKTIAAAIASYPKNHPANTRYVIYVKAGVYKEEKLTIRLENVFMYGDGPDKTIITGDKSQELSHDPVLYSGSLSVIGKSFVGKSIGFHNTAGPQGGQAVALMVMGDRSALFNCKMEGYQDTLFANTNRQFYRDCVISGTIDFVFGTSATLIQNSQIILRKPKTGQHNVIAADGSDRPNSFGGLVFQNCNIYPDKTLFPVKSTVKTFLGRPWKPYSRAIFMQSTMADFIDPAGWMEWQPGNPQNQNCFFAEYANKGAGARTQGRVTWKSHKIITDPKEANQYTLAPFFQGDIGWLKTTGIPFYLGLGTQE